MPRILAVKENNMSSPFSKSFLSKNPISLTQKQEDNLPPNLVKEIVKDEEKKETPLTMVDYTDYGTESGYVSTRASLQNMFDGITKGTLAAIEGLKDPQTQADRLGRRVASRNKRASNKGAEGTDKRTAFDETTAKIKKRQEGLQGKADADMQRKLDQYQAMQSLRKNNPEDVKKYNDWLNTPEGKNSTDVEKQLKFKSLNLT